MEVRMSGALVKFVGMCGVMLVSLTWISEAQAMTLRCTSNVVETSVGQVAQVSVIADLDDARINTIGAALVLSPDLGIADVVEDTAFPGLWVQKPTSNDLRFSKMIPGGIQGKDRRIFSILVQPRAAGEASVAFSDAEAYRHDGVGTPEAVTVQGCTIRVAESGYLTILPPKQADHEPPDPFVPVVLKEDGVFEGQSFLIFSANDVGSGIDHYELREVSTGLPWSRFRAFKAVQSPFVLSDQSLASDIQVRAIDRFGNIREVLVPAAHPVPHSRTVIMSILLILTILAFIAILWRFYKRLRDRRGSSQA